MFIVTLFSLKFNITIFYFDKIFVFKVPVYPGYGSAWIRIHFESWIRTGIRIFT
jgi:hypothetical protein